MRTIFPILMTVGLTSAGIAQTPPEGYELIPGRLSGTTAGISMVSRPTAGGEILAMYDERYVMGLGDLRGSARGLNKASDCEIKTIKLQYQDQNRATQEAFKIVARSESTTTARAADLGTPLFTQDIPAAPSGTGIGSFLLTITIMDQSTTPATASAIPVPCDKSFFVGMDIPALPSGTSWPNDGLTIAVTNYDLVSTFTTHDWPKGGTNADPLYYVKVGAAGGRFAGPPMLPAIALVPDAPVLQIGALHEANSSPTGADENFAASGIWPEIDGTTTRGGLSQDGLVMRITDNNVTSTQAGLYGVYLGINTAKSLGLPYFNIPGISGGIYLGLPTVFLTSGALTTPDTIVTLGAPKSLPTTALLNTTLYFQGYTSVNGVDSLTNMAGVQFK